MSYEHVPTAPNPRVIDLDAKRAARAELRSQWNPDPITIVLAGVAYRLPDEMPADFADLITHGQFRSAFESILGDGFDAFWADLSVDDLRDISDALAPAYGIGGGSGNSSGSGGSSRTTGAL